MKYEALIFNDELELLEARLRETCDVVDGYILIEAPMTFTGKPKPMHYAENVEQFVQWNEKIHHVPVDLPVRDGAWACERAQRNALHRVLDEMDGEDIVLLCDADELVSARAWQNFDPSDGTHVLPMRQQYFTLTWATPNHPPPNGGVMARSRFAYRRDIGLAASWADGQYGLQVADAGWHLSCLGGPDRLCAKLQSFSHTELSDPAWANVENCARMIREGIDIDPNRKWRLSRVNPQGPSWLLDEGVKRWPWLLTGGV